MGKYLTASSQRKQKTINGCIQESGSPLELGTNVLNEMTSLVNRTDMILPVWMSSTAVILAL